MKSKIIQDQESEQQIAYPILMQEVTYGYVILFTSEQTGIVVYGVGIYKIGAHSHHWTSATNKEAWEPFKGKIELSN